MTIEEMKKRKQELGYSYQQIADLAGLPLGTVQRILSGQTKNPRYETLTKLKNVLRQEQKGTRDSGWEDSASARSVQETPLIYGAGSKRQGEYTVEDYHAIPEGVRAELIDGHLYYWDSPRVKHNVAIMEICAAIHSYIKEKGGPCIVVPGPTDVQLDEDDRTMVVPDAVILCDPSKYEKGFTIGAPDFCLEVVSPSNPENDYLRKYRKYYEAGVREYWIVDPQKMVITVYDFEHNGPVPKSYTFADKIPVAIYGGDLVIDLSDIVRYMA